MASISSTKMMAGARLRASSNRSRTRAAPRAAPPVTLRVLQELHDFGDLLLDALVPSDVAKGCLRPLSVEDLGAGATDPQDSAELGPGPTAQIEPEPHEEQERGEGQQDRPERRPLGDRLDRHPPGLQTIEQPFAG